MALLCIVLITIGCLIARVVFLNAAERFIHDYYRSSGLHNYNSSYNTDDHR